MGLTFALWRVDYAPTMNGERSRRVSPHFMAASATAGDAGLEARNGHVSFRSAFEEAERVAGLGAPPREIQVRWDPGSRSYIWTIKY